MFKVITNFKYNDIILYCKGWYYKNGNMLEDLGYLFSKIYGWVPTDIKDIAYFMLRAYTSYLYESGQTHNYDAYNDSIANFQRAINDYMRLYECDFNMACIKWVRSFFIQVDIKTIKLNRPIYGKKQYFRMGPCDANKGISMTYKHVNDIAIKTFCKDT